MNLSNCRPIFEHFILSNFKASFNISLWFEKSHFKSYFMLYLDFWNDFFCRTTKESIFIPFHENKDSFLNILFPNYRGIISYVVNFVTTTLTGLSNVPLRTWRTCGGRGEGSGVGESTDTGVSGRHKSVNNLSLQPGVDASSTSVACGPWSWNGLEVRVIVPFVVFVATGVEVANPETSSSVSPNVSCLT